MHALNIEPGGKTVGEGRLCVHISPKSPNTKWKCQFWFWILLLSDCVKPTCDKYLYFLIDTVFISCLKNSCVYFMHCTETAETKSILTPRYSLTHPIVSLLNQIYLFSTSYILSRSVMSFLFVISLLLHSPFLWWLDLTSDLRKSEDISAKTSLLMKRWGRQIVGYICSWSMFWLRMISLMSSLPYSTAT